MIQTDFIKEIAENTVEISNALYQSEYKVVFALSLQELEQTVNEHLIQNWRCIGGVVLDKDKYLQTMVK